MKSFIRWGSGLVAAAGLAAGSLAFAQQGAPRPPTQAPHSALAPKFQMHGGWAGAGPHHGMGNHATMMRGMPGPGHGGAAMRHARGMGPMMMSGMGAMTPGGPGMAGCSGQMGAKPADCCAAGPETSEGRPDTGSK